MFHLNISELCFATYAVWTRNVTFDKLSVIPVIDTVLVMKSYHILLLECPALLSQLKLLYPTIKDLVIQNIGLVDWNEIFNSKESIVQLIMDCSIFSEIHEKPVSTEILRISREICFRLHFTRLNKLM